MRNAAPSDISEIEIIEVIDDGTDPFGDRPPNTTVHDTGGPRWVGPTAAAALVALIGYGIATSASTSSVPKVAEAPSTTVSPTTTQPTTPTTQPQPVVPYYSADPPREYRVQYAEINPGERDVFFPGDYQLWAMPGASATSGSWFSIESFRTGGAQSIYAVDAFRVPTPEQTMVISRLPSGQSILQFSVDSRMAVTITAFGWSDEDLVRLARSVTINQRSSGDYVAPSDPTLIDDFQMLTTVQPYQAIFGDPIEQLFYSVGSDPRLGFGIGVVHLDPRGGDAAVADRNVALRFFVDRATPFEVDGHSAVAGDILGRPDQAVATWIAGDHMVWIAGTLSVQEVMKLARTVHQVSSEVWEGMRFQAAGNGNGFGGDYTETQPHPVSFGTDANGAQWTVNVSVSMSPGGQSIAVNWQWLPGSGYGSVSADVAKITSVVDGDRTFVVAELPRSIAPTAQLQVARTGLDPVLVPFNDTDPGVDRTFAAFAFSEPTTYTAQIIGPDGAVLATWPSS